MKMEMTESSKSAVAKEDEWVFTLRLPPSVEVNDYSETTRTRTKSPPSSPRCVQLRQTQRRSEPKSESPSEESELSSSAEHTAKQEEQKSLLENADASLQVSSSYGWTLTSPFWCFSSDILLKITFRPAWQAIPEYTFCHSCASARWTTSCCCTCTCCTDRIDYFADTFTVSDIVKIQKIPAFSILGIGDCQAIKVHLRPLHSEDLPLLPDYLRPAWERHVHNMSSNRTTEPEGTGNSVGPVLTFCLPKKQVDSPLLWKVDFPPLQTPIAVESLTVADGTLHTNISSSPEPTHIYINGYQSWSFAGSIAKGCDQPQSALPSVFSGAFMRGGTPPPPATTTLLSSTTIEDDDDLRPPFVPHYQSDFFTCITADTQVPDYWRSTRRERRFPYQQLDETGGPALMLGWLAQRKQFGVICADQLLKRYQLHASSAGGQVMWAGVTGGITTDWAYAQLLSPHSYDEEPMVHYLHSVAAHNRARPIGNGSLLTGWCSWYHYYENISVNNLRENFAKLAGMRTKVPTNVSVVDDGYMTAWGDWDSLKPGKFPQSGMGIVANDITSYGMRPGLWLAPFAADKHSQIAKEHPDWIIKNDAGIAANSANCGKFFYGLDASNPDVRKHAFESVRRAVAGWDFNVLKIDFLYAACLEGNGKHDLSMSRAQAMHLALKTIRDAAGPDVFLIGCGCPIATGIGFVDGMRVSADTGPTWYPPLPFPWWDQGTLPCLRSMVRNSISRAPLGHRWWHNDPDCLLLGESTRLTDVEVASAATIVAMTCGMMLLSDDLTKVSLTRMRILTKIFPMTGVSAVVLDLHNTNDGLPSLMRLWCTDKYRLADSFMDKLPAEGTGEIDHNAEATYFARQASFRPDQDPESVTERKRSCIHVTKGLGTWSVVSISNWSNSADVVYIPPPALLPPPVTGWEDDEPEPFLAAEEAEQIGRYGYHVFAFWSSKYSWLPDHRRHAEQSAEHTISKKLAPHETEIFHIRPVTPEVPQYLGSDLHFSCGKEVRYFTASKNSVHMTLKTDFNRVGHIFVFVPRINTDNVRVSVSGKPGRWRTVGNTPRINENGSPRLVGRVIRIMLVVQANGLPDDGQIKIEF